MTKLTVSETVTILQRSPAFREFVDVLTALRDDARDVYEGQAANEFNRARVMTMNELLSLITKGN
jgi:hypothetical protein